MLLEGMWWDFFWKEVANIIPKTLGFDLDSTFISLYLGYIPDGLDIDNSYLLKILKIQLVIWHSI